MERRDFIINTSLCAGALLLGCGCSNTQNNSNIKYPNSVKLESCTLCQLSCPRCWRTAQPDKMTLGYLKFEDFKKFVNKNPFIKHIELSNYGEMFLNPDLDKIINYAYDKNIKLSANTGVNLNTLSDEMAELLVTKNFEELLISIDGATQEIYSIYRVGGDLNKVIENIKKIQFYQKKHNSKFPKMIYKFIVFGHNEHEIPKAKELAKSLGLPIQFAINFVGDYSPIKNYDFVQKETGLNVKAISEKDYNNSYLGIIYENYKKDGVWFFCTSLFNEPVIFYDGTFTACCMGHYNNAPDINVFKTGLKKALNDKRIKKMVDCVAMKTDAKGTMCNDCMVYKFLKRNHLIITEEGQQELKNKHWEMLNG